MTIGTAITMDQVWRIESFRKLKKDINLLVRYDSHKLFLETCLKKSLIPKGFRLKWKLNLAASEFELNNINNIKEDTSLNLMKESLRIVYAKIENINHSIESNEQLVKTTVSPDEYVLINNYISVYRSKLTSRMCRIKNKKVSGLSTISRGKLSSGHVIQRHSISTNSPAQPSRNERHHFPRHRISNEANQQVDEHQTEPNSIPIRNSNAQGSPSTNPFPVHFPVVIPGNLQWAKNKNNPDLKTSSSGMDREGQTTNIRGDGNCFFRSLSYLMYETEIHHPGIRHKVVKEMAAHRNEYSPFIDGNVEDHLVNMSFEDGRLSSWATEAEIFAASSCFKVDIFVRLSDHTDAQWIRTSRSEACNHDNDFLCLDYKNNHFNAVKRSTRPCQCLVLQGRIAPEVVVGRGSETNDKKEQTSIEKVSHHIEGVFQAAKNTRNVHAQFPVNYSLRTRNRFSSLDIDTGNDSTSVSDDISLAHNQRKPRKNRGGKKKDNSKRSIVTNLSTKAINPGQISLLEKGLSFVSTKEKVNVGKLIADMENWERRLRLKEYFHKDSQDQNYINDVNEWEKKKSKNWSPTDGREKDLDVFINNVKSEILNGLKRDHKMNLSTKEKKSLQGLMNDESVVIRPADKGSGIVIMDASHYANKIEEALQSNETYKEVELNLTEPINNKLKKLLDKLLKTGLISQELRDNLLCKEIYAGKVQGNPKLHKPGNPMRLIVNGRNHPTSQVARFVEDQLTNHVRSLPSFVQDSTDFIRKLEKIQTPLPPNCIIFCMDVKALYPSVPRKEAREAVMLALNNGDQHFSTSMTLELMDFALENNNFQFNGKNFLQIEGTAIGSHLGANYASTYMGVWENTLLNRSRKKPLLYLRYIDDIIGLWTHGEEDLKEFHAIANSIHKNIEVDLRTSQSAIEFLDVLISQENGILSTDIYSKPTDRHLYLQQDSSHPYHTKRSIPYGLAIRAKRICSDTSKYEKQKETIIANMCKRGHNEKLVENEVSKVDKFERNQLLTYKPKLKPQKIPLTTTYSPALPNLNKIIKENEQKLYKNERLRQIFESKLVVGYKRDQNLKDILVHRKHNNLFNKLGKGTEKCGKSCALCSHIITSDSFNNEKGDVFQVGGYINCKSRNLVYSIYCCVCCKYVYVGETGDTLYQRMLLNFSRIRTGRSDPVGDHFRQGDHNVNDLKVLGIEKISGDSIYRKTKERLWKSKLNTYKPHGLNSYE